MQNTIGLPKEIVESIVKHLDSSMQTIERRIKELPEAPIKKDALRHKRRTKAQLKFWRAELLRVSSLRTEL
jgi:hypothetical protein